MSVSKAAKAPKAAKRYIFVTGGVVSALGKGLTAAGIAALLQARGYSVRLRKLDPYLNVDPGTMSPMEHGEVFVTEDGAETDLDLGHYERFTGVETHRGDSISAGRIYQNVLDRERQGEFLGQTIQVIPHVTDEILRFLHEPTEGQKKPVDFMLCEIGGTVGDIEGLPFYEALRQFKQQADPGTVAFVHLALVPYIETAGELKTKPVQHSVKELLSIGIQPDILLCRNSRHLLDETRRKISLFCNLPPESVIDAPDLDSIYQVPGSFHRQKLDQRILEHFGLPVEDLWETRNPDLEQWDNITYALQPTRGKKSVGIEIYGKYTGNQDAYKSLAEALVHGGLRRRVKVYVRWLDADSLLDRYRENPGETTESMSVADGILVPGGFGVRGMEGKITAIQLARENKIPFLGICLGMQLALLETARNLADFPQGYSEEFLEPGETPTVSPMVLHLAEWIRENTRETRDATGPKGGTLRLGAYPAVLSKGSLARKLYGKTRISERHRHRYEVNLEYQEMLEAHGMRFTGFSPDGKLAEIVERPDHPWFLGVQFHPELKSRPFDPHPIFEGFIEAALERKNQGIKGK